MKYQLENDVILIETIQDKNIFKCVQTRKLNQTSFFEQIQQDSDSEQWIRDHQFSADNVLLEIIFKPEKCFVGTIGFTKYDDSAEVGRFSFFTPAIKSLIRTGIPLKQLQEIGKSACLLMLDYLFQRESIKRVYCEVLPENRYSNDLCTRLGGSPMKRRKIKRDGSLIEILYYEISKEGYLNGL